MRTHKVRPVLVESKEPNKLRLNNKSKLTFEPQIKGLHYNGLVHTYQQLILISLEDEKIEVGDIIYSEILNQFEALKEMPKGDLKFWFDGIFKVIATQDQLSSKLIQQLVNEYNNGGMKDFEIEWDYREGEFLTELENCPYAPTIDEPKLTNGFITPVKKEQLIFE